MLIVPDIPETKEEQLIREERILKYLIVSKNVSNPEDRNRLFDEIIGKVEWRPIK